MNNELQELFAKYDDARVSGATGLPLAQVEVVNRYERRYEIEVAICWDRVLVEFNDDDDIHRAVHVLPDGSLDWTLAGVFPELAKWNTPA